MDIDEGFGDEHDGVGAEGWWLPFLLQTTDTAFPTGAYAHSFGFEEAVNRGLAHDEATLLRFGREHVVPALAAFELPYLRFAHAAATDGDFGTLQTLDAEVGAAKLARETREGSATVGRRRLKALRVLLPEDRRLAEYECRIGAAEGSGGGHHAIVSGLAAAVLGVPLRVALAAHFYGATAGLCAAAPKLLRIGPDACQRVLRALNRDESAGASVRHSLAVAREDAGWFDPLLEIASMAHERAEERLFIS